MRKRALAVAFAALFIFAGTSLAQAPQAPKPGPEQKRLGYFLGRWNIEAEMKQSPSGPGGKTSITENEQWLPGGFFLVSHEEIKGDGGEGKGLSILGYDPGEKVYTYHAFNSWGEAESAKGTYADGTWTWTSESNLNGKLTKTRYTVHELSKTSYTIKFEMAGEDGNWSSIMEGKAVKVTMTAAKASPAKP
jgi:hypothetical protein